MLVAYKIYDQTLKMGDVTLKHLAIEFQITQITVYKMAIDCIEPTAGSVISAKPVFTAMFDDVLINLLQISLKRLMGSKPLLK